MSKVFRSSVYVNTISDPGNLVVLTIFCGELANIELQELNPSWTELKLCLITLFLTKSIGNAYLKKGWGKLVSVLAAAVFGDHRAGRSTVARGLWHWCKGA